MGWEAINSDAQREIENARLERLRLMSVCTDMYVAVTMLRDLSTRILENLYAYGPPGVESHPHGDQGSQNEGQHDIFAGIKVVSEPIDTYWWRLLEETACTLIMIRELVTNRPDRHVAIAEYGVGKYVILCIPEALTKIINVFAVRTYICPTFDGCHNGEEKSRANPIDSSHSVRSNIDINKDVQMKTYPPSAESGHVLYTHRVSLAQAGVTCIRALSMYIFSSDMTLL